MRRRIRSVLHFIKRRITALFCAHTIDYSSYVTHCLYWDYCLHNLDWIFFDEGDGWIPADLAHIRSREGLSMLQRDDQGQLLLVWKKVNMCALQKPRM